MLKFIGNLIHYWQRFANKCIGMYVKNQFEACGHDVYIGPNCIFTPSTVSCGSHVYFGAGCVVQSAHGEIKLGNHIMFGPGVHVHGGNHKYNHIGKYMDMVKKEMGEDAPVIIEDDVWVGSNAMILAGVHVGKGVIIGGGVL